MSEFTKYQHVERVTHQECEGLLEGLCYVFPKIDGTNASVWINEGSLCSGSRNRELSEESDNAGFHKWIISKLDQFLPLFVSHENYILYGEWLVPHSLKTYRDEAWRDFYVFDVLDTFTGLMLPYEAYKDLLEEHKINYIPPLAKIKDPNSENLLQLLERSGEFLIKDGHGKGEGIVVKNYDFVNKYGRQVWGKMVTNEFKEVHTKTMGAPEINSTLLVEEQIVRDHLTEEFIKKEQAKIVSASSVEFFDNSMIGETLGRVWYEFIREETWNWVKEHKGPKVNFRLLQNLVFKKTKEVIGV